MSINTMNQAPGLRGDASSSCAARCNDRVEIGTLARCLLGMYALLKLACCFYDIVRCNCKTLLTNKALANDAV